MSSKSKSRGRYCCIPQCKSYSAAGIHLYQVPSGKEKRFAVKTEDWAKQLHQVLFRYRDCPDFRRRVLDGKTFICEYHFKESDIQKCSKRSWIKHGCIPSLHLPNKSIETAVPKQRRIIIKHNLAPSTPKVQSYITAMMDPFLYEREMQHTFQPWTVDDVNTLLGLISSKYSLDWIDGHTRRNQAIFMRLEKEFKELGKEHRWHQIRSKWKSLKKMYYKCVRRGEDKMDSRGQWTFFKQMHDLLTNPKWRTRRNFSNIQINKVIPVPHTTSDTSQSLANKQVENEGFDTDEMILKSIIEEGTDEIPSISEISESEEDYDIGQILRTMKEEGEKDRQTTMQAVEMLANAMKESIDKLISSREFT